MSTPSSPTLEELADAVIAGETPAAAARERLASLHPAAPDAAELHDAVELSDALDRAFGPPAQTLSPAVDRLLHALRHTPLDDVTATDLDPAAPEDESDLELDVDADMAATHGHGFEQLDGALRAAFEASCAPTGAADRLQTALDAERQADPPLRLVDHEAPPSLHIDDFRDRRDGRELLAAGDEFRDDDDDKPASPADPTDDSPGNRGQH